MFSIALLFVFSLYWHGLKRPTHLGVISINGWEPIAIYDYVDKLGDDRHCESGDTIFLICLVNSQVLMFMRFSGLKPVMGKSPC